MSTEKNTTAQAAIVNQDETEINWWSVASSVAVTAVTFGIGYYFGGRSATKAAAILDD